MDNIPQTKITTHAKRNIWIILLCLVAIIVIFTTSFWYNQEIAIAAGTCRVTKNSNCKRYS